jgi:hypothetical protein
MSLPKYVKKAQNNYNSKFDLVQIKLPKGTKEKIRDVIKEDDTISGFCLKAVLNAIENGDQFKKYDEKKQKDELQAMLDAARARHATNNYEDREQKRRDTIAAASDINEGLADYKKPDLDTYLNV